MSAEEKFFFNVHNFDDDVIDEPAVEEIVEDLPPPPPVFSESQLEAAKKAAFKEGHQKGVEETEASRAQALVGVMQKLATDVQTLFSLESEREKQYQQEVLLLCRTLFEQVFPALHAKHGMEELLVQLENVLEGQRGQRRIRICVSNDYLQGVQAFMDKLQATHSDMDFEVIADETTEDGGFKISWDNGGALYDTPSIAQKILGNLDEILADQGLTSHDKCEEDSKVSSEMTDVGSGNTDNDDPTVEDNHDG